ncbi:MAG: TRAP transporter small permease [Bacillota bacterium]|jgi:TRAP-type C4-dicarboxylate transport system permease small subunit
MGLRDSRSLRFLQSVSAMLFGIIVVVTFGQVVCRYVFNAPLFWAEEVARYSFIWMSFLAAAVAVGQDAHTNISFALNALPARVRRVVVTLNYSLGAIFFAVVGYNGVRIAVNVASDRSPGIGLPMNYVYLSLPVASVFAILYLAGAIVRTWSRRDTDADGSSTQRSRE